MKTLYRPLDAFSHDWLETSSAHRIYYEQSGNPEGIPVLFIHGGPGSSCHDSHRRFFDPARYHIILFDQRGCGRSLPLGETADNNTQALIADMERLRQHLNIERWLLFGGSWGCTLGLAYTQAHSAAVVGLILRGVFLAQESELDWYLNGLRIFAPEARAALFEATPEKRPLDYFYHAVTHDNTDIALAAARIWVQYENRIMALGEEEGKTADNTGLPDALLLARARVQLHYLFHNCFLTPGQLLKQLARITHLPAIIVQGRLDMVCPPGTAHTLHQAWPGSQLKMVAQGKHAASHPVMIDGLVCATDYFASTLAR